MIPGLGGPFGSTKIDRVFQDQFLAQKLSPEALKSFQDADPVGALMMMDAWEALKCGFDPNAPTRHFFPIPAKLYRILLKDHNHVLEKLAQEQQGEEASLILTGATLKQIFDPILDESIKLIQKALDQLGDRGCDFIYTVGGLSTCRYLQERIKASFGDRVKIVSPPVPSAAIVEGAVLMGLNPDLMIRRSRLTYGFDCSMPFQDGKDPHSKRHWSDVRDKYFCSDRFAILVVAGDEIGPNEQRGDYCAPGGGAMAKAEFFFYATPKKHARYIDEPGVTKIGSVICEREGDAQHSKEGWDIIFYFGKTELTASVHDRATGKTTKADLHFSQTYSPELLGE